MHGVRHDKEECLMVGTLTRSDDGADGRVSLSRVGFLEMYPRVATKGGRAGLRGPCACRFCSSPGPRILRWVRATSARPPRPSTRPLVATRGGAPLQQSEHLDRNERLW